MKYPNIVRFEILRASLNFRQEQGFQCGTSTISVPRVCSNPGTSRRASCCQGSCNLSSRSNKSSSSSNSNKSSSSTSNSSNKCCTPPSAPPPPANDGANSSGPSKPRGKHPVSKPNVMTAEDRAHVKHSVSMFQIFNMSQSIYQSTSTIQYISDIQSAFFIQTLSITQLISN
ncbi:hypothetical protein EAF00_010271 [Botryotinia globosa]|nr:hypothetical protein EAF00_010271 [Botryotinia globosa]